MKVHPAPDNTIDDILSPLPEKILRMTQSLRSLIKNQVPGVTEKGYPVWKGIGYTHKESGYFCAIFPFQDYLKLGFEYGILLPDKYKKLSGTGSQLRYFVIEKENDFSPEMISYYLRESLKLPGPKKIKMELIRSIENKKPKK